MSSDERSRVPNRLWIALLAVAAITLVAELFIHHHAYFGVDGSYAFYAWYTVGVGLIGVLVARVVATVLGRREDDDA